MQVRVMGSLSVRDERTGQSVRFEQRPVAPSSFREVSSGFEMRGVGGRGRIVRNGPE
jgi:hypothetical protein